MWRQGRAPRCHTLADVHALVLRSRPMLTHSRKRRPPATRRRALELLAVSPDGCTEAIMVAHGFAANMLADLIRDGLATAGTERVVAGGRSIEVARVRVTDTGRRVLVGRGKP
jgi:hypothetical protein